MAVNEAELMRECAPLYLSIALESLSTFLMGLVFLYLLLLITNRGRLQKPGQAFRRFLMAEMGGFVKDLSEHVSKWGDMQTQPLEAQLILLIAPIVPFYRCNMIFTYVVTTIMELSAWSGSLIDGKLFSNMDEAWATGDLSIMQPQQKFFAILPGVTILCFLLFVQLPVLQLLFVCKKSQLKELGCPPGYVKLLLICQITWIAFPVWWLIGFEGLALIKDTKANGVGFALLNILSKATFSVHMISISGRYRKQLQREKRRLKGECSTSSLSSQISNESSDSTRGDLEVPPPAQESWFVRVLRPYDHDLNVPVQWKKLDREFKAFLMGKDITPSKYDDMSMA